MNKYNYDRRRNYGSRNTSSNSTASSMVFLISLVIICIVWILNIKSDANGLKDENEMLRSENSELVHKVDSLLKKPEAIEAPIVEIKPKKIFKRPVKDTIKVKPVVIPEVKAVIAVDTTK